MAEIVIRDLTPEGAEQNAQPLGRLTPVLVTVPAGFEHARLVMVRATRHEVVGVTLTTGRGVENHIVNGDSRSPQQLTLLARGDDYWAEGETVFLLNAEDESLEITLQ